MKCCGEIKTTSLEFGRIEKCQGCGAYTFRSTPSEHGQAAARKSNRKMKKEGLI